MNIFFHIDGWEDRWVVSDWKKNENLTGKWNYTSGKWNGDPNDKGALFTLYYLCINKDEKGSETYYFYLRDLIAGVVLFIKNFQATYIA